MWEKIMGMYILQPQQGGMQDCGGCVCVILDFALAKRGRKDAIIHFKEDLKKKSYIELISPNQASRHGRGNAP